MLEFIAFAIVLAFIAILFYKQANEDFEILQLDAERFQELPNLYADRSPIVIRGFSVPSLGNREELAKRPHIYGMAVTPGVSLRDMAEGATPSVQVSVKTAEFLSKESGLHIWFDHHLYKELLPSPWTTAFYSFRTTLWPHRRGLYKTTAFQTVIMPTQGAVTVSLLLPKMIPYLPSKWEGRQFSSLTAHDTPLLNQIQFIEVIVRKGTLLLLPAHVLVNMEPLLSSHEKHGQEASSMPWIFQAEVHHPISRLAS